MKTPPQKKQQQQHQQQHQQQQHSQLHHHHHHQHQQQFTNNPNPSNFAPDQPNLYARGIEKSDFLSGSLILSSIFYFYFIILKFIFIYIILYSINYLFFNILFSIFHLFPPPIYLSLQPLGFSTIFFTLCQSHLIYSNPHPYPNLAGPLTLSQPHWPTQPIPTSLAHSANPTTQPKPKT